jgi:hypothetical protein
MMIDLNANKKKHTGENPVIYTESSKKNATILNYCNYVNYYLTTSQLYLKT